MLVRSVLNLVKTDVSRIFWETGQSGSSRLPFHFRLVGYLHDVACQGFILSKMLTRVLSLRQPVGVFYSHALYADGPNVIFWRG